MAYSATLANLRGVLSDADHQRILGLFSKAGLSMDHHQFDEEILDKGTQAILRTRDGLLRAAVPSPLGKCIFLNDVSLEEMLEALRAHKELMKKYPRNGEGIEAFVDSSDTGYTVNGKPVEAPNMAKKDMVNGNGLAMNGVSAAVKHASGADTPESVDSGFEEGTNGHVDGINGHANGVTNGH